jgi:hypothetical protein
VSSEGSVVVMAMIVSVLAGFVIKLVSGSDSAGVGEIAVGGGGGCGGCGCDGGRGCGGCGCAGGGGRAGARVKVSGCTITHRSEHSCVNVVVVDGTHADRELGLIQTCDSN